MDTNEKKEVIDIRDIIKIVLSKKKLFIKTLACAFVLSCLWIFPKPRTYETSVTVAPEMADLQEAGSLSSLASSFGINLNDMATTDAFYPDIYPDIIATNEFIAGLMKVRIKTIDGAIDTDYYTYLKKHRKVAFYQKPFIWFSSLISKISKSEPSKVSSDSINSTNGFNTFMLNKKDALLFDLVRNDVSCEVDKKNGIITISAKAQDPLVCALIADSARIHLQEFITRYRTNKAKIDYDYYKKLATEAKEELFIAQKAFSDYCDSHMNIIRQAEQSKRDALENELSIKLTTYNTLYTQMMAAHSKIQEATPAFSLLKSASVPIKASAPKRMIFVIFMLFLTAIGTTIYIFKRDILNNLMHGPNEKNHS